jgi:hypothetical protein
MAELEDDLGARARQRASWGLGASRRLRTGHRPRGATAAAAPATAAATRESSPPYPCRAAGGQADRLRVVDEALPSRGGAVPRS